jgi:hypothetical protein
VVIKKQKTKKHKKTLCKPGAVAHAYNPSYSGIGD